MAPVDIRALNQSQHNLACLLLSGTWGQCYVPRMPVGQVHCVATRNTLSKHALEGVTAPMSAVLNRTLPSLYAE